MILAYKTLFTVPGTRALVAAGLLARLSLPMTGIGIITMLSVLHGSYALAGAVSAVFVLVYALLSPQISRLVDVHGQNRVLPIASAVSVVGLLGLAACAQWGAPQWAFFPAAALAGFMPSMSAMVRARWTQLYRGEPRLQMAYSLETVFDEVSFIVGPALSVALSLALFAPAGLLACALLLVLGTALLLSLRGTQPPVLSPSPSLVQVSGCTQVRAGSVLRGLDVRVLTALMVAMGAIVGTVDLVSLAFAAQLGQPAQATIVLAAYALGSCVSGLLFGARQWKTPHHNLLCFCACATALTTLVWLLASSVAALALSTLLAGVFFAPTMIVAMTLIEQLVPAHRLTEGITWLLAGLNVGVAMGAALAGQVVDAFGVRAGFGIAIGAALAVCALALWQAHRMHQRAGAGGESACEKAQGDDAGGSRHE